MQTSTLAADDGSTSSRCAFALSAGVQTWPLDTSAAEPRYLVEVGADRRFEVSGGVRLLLELLQSGLSKTDELASGLRQRGYHDATEASVAQLFQQTLVPCGMATPLDGEPAIAPPERPRPKPSSYLLVQVPLISAATLRPLTGLLRFLFKPMSVAAVLLLVFSCHLYFYSQLFARVEWTFIHLPLVHLLLLVVVTNFFTIVHELGHATACRYYRCDHGSIGWGIYLFTLVLYTDVSRAWRLKRRQRVVVDAGGMYFESMASAVVLGLLLFSGSELWALAFVLLDVSLLGSLNPVLRRDGYWLLTDLAGHTNLRDANLGVLRRMIDRLRRRPSPGGGAELAGPPWLRALILVYSGLTVIFSLALLGWLGYRIGHEVVPAVPGLCAQILERLALQPSDYLGASAATIRLLFGVGFVVLVVLSLWRFGRSCVRALVTGAA